MYKVLAAKSLVDHIAPILYLNKHFMSQPYFEQLPLLNHCTYDITQITYD